MEEVKMDSAPLKGKIREVFKSQEAFAKADGRSLTSVANIINGKSRMSRQTMIKWATMLKIPLNSSEMIRVFLSSQN